MLEDSIKELVRDELGDEAATMSDTSDLSCPTFVVATSGLNVDGPAVLLRSYGCKGFNANTCLIWQAARATTASPLFFKPMFIDTPLPGAWYIDGGITHNNPSELALEEARRKWTTVKQFCLISIGTGRQAAVAVVDSRGATISTEIDGSPHLKRRIICVTPGAHFFERFVRAPNDMAALDIMDKACFRLSNTSEFVHDRVMKRSNSSNSDPNFLYHRFNVERGLENIGLEEWNQMIVIGAHTARYLHEGEGQNRTNACVQDLVNPPPVRGIFKLTRYLQ